MDTDVASSNLPMVNVLPYTPKSLQVEKISSAPVIFRRRRRRWRGIISRFGREVKVDGCKNARMSTSTGVEWKRVRGE